jgi:hypothetical protein
MSFFAELWIVLTLTHFAIDFSFQSDTLARQKSPRTANDLAREIPWWWWMTGHAATHALGVYVVLSSLFAVSGPLVVGCALGEFTEHFLRDRAKCVGFISISTDQVGHVLTKMLIAAAIARWAVPG